MSIRPKFSKLIENRQRKLYIGIVGAAIVTAGSIVYFSADREETKPVLVTNSFQIPTEDTKPENVRLGLIENESDLFKERLSSLEKSLVELKETNSVLEIEKNQTIQETESLRNQISSLQEEIQHKTNPLPSHPSHFEEEPDHSPLSDDLKVWSSPEEKTDRSVLFEIPAGTVVKAVLVSGADCSVAVHSPVGPNLMLLRILDNGKLPKSVRVPLKGTQIICNAWGEISTERVHIRAERMTLTEKNGSFIETEISAYVSGEDGRQGLRGVVVDRSGQIVTRAAFAAFLQGVGQSMQAVLNNQVIEKLSEIGPDQTILNVDTFRNAGFQGSITAFDKMADYYIKRAEQLQPAIQVAAGRIVDVIFLKTVKIGEKDLKKKFDHERALKKKEAQNDS